MQSLSEAIVGIVVGIIVLLCLPFIIKLFSLCFIIWLVFMVVKEISGTDDVPVDNTGTNQKESGYQSTWNEQNNGHSSAGSYNTRSDCSHSGWRNSYDDDYDSRYDDYCDDHYISDDIPPEGGDGFRGTGAPFL
ncbi:MAG: hypothetical protein IJV46_00250 [Acidaminococcaceae bacterium]|nr:hypothetical protein [Acidaminococcaceae bacterium]